MYKMNNLVCKLFILKLILIINNVQAQDPNLSIQKGVKNVDSTSDIIDKDSVRNFYNLTRIEDLLDLFNMNEIGAQWKQIHDKVNPICAQNMMEYLNGLEQRTIWAIKMDDASGHYATGFFWGNNYWTGSMALCRNIYKDDDDFVRKAPKNDGLSTSNGNGIGNMEISHVNPPFFPRFGVLKVVINDTQTTPTPRTIHIGICLPSSCQIDDLNVIAEHAGKPLDTRDVQVTGIRIPNSDGFTIWKDNTFVIMLTVSLTVLIFIIWGTAYDTILTRRVKNKLTLNKYSKDLNSDSSGLNCTTYDLTRAISNDKKSNCVGIGMPTGVNNNSDENLAMEPCVEEQKLNIYEELLLSFSVVTNFKAICDRAVGSDTIPSIHGLRVLSMCWIILGHTCVIAFKYSDNMELRKVVEKEFIFQTVTNGAFSVDTFFFISGFLVSFLYFRTNAKGKLEKLTAGVNEFTAGSYHFFGLVGYRFIRLTAPYLYVLGVVEVCMKYFASNSVFEPPTMDHVNCPKYWWRNVLYINTLFPVQDMCMLWSWYLANDTQFYLLGAIILIVAIRHFKLAATTMVFFMVAAWLTTGIIAYTNNHMPNTDDPLALFDKIYDKPWTRLGPYLVGMSVGWILFKTDCKIKFTKLQLITGWSLSTGTLLWLLYGLFKVELSQLAAAAYSSLSHTAWAVSLAWVIIACSTGNGGFLNKMLSATYWYPFSRVTYCAYLVHPLVIRAYALNSDSPIHMGKDTMFIIFLGQTLASYVVAFLVSLSFEAPVVTMLKILSPNRKKHI